MSLQGITVAQEEGNNCLMSMRLMKIIMIMMEVREGAGVKMAIEERVVEKEDLVALIDQIEVIGLIGVTGLTEAREDHIEALNQGIDHPEREKLLKIQLKTQLTQL